MGALWCWLATCAQNRYTLSIDFGPWGCCPRDLLSFSEINDFAGPSISLSGFSPKCPRALDLPRVQPSAALWALLDFAEGEVKGAKRLRGKGCRRGSTQKLSSICPALTLSQALAPLLAKGDVKASQAHQRFQ